MPTAVIDCPRGPSAEAFLGLMRTWRSRLVFMANASEHDKRMALVQSLTHATVLAFGMALKSLGYRLEDVREMMTPPHSLLVMVLARLIDAGPDVYWDIQTENPYAADVRAQLLESLTRFDESVNRCEPDEFAQMFREIEDCLQPSIAELASACNAVIELHGHS